VSLQDNQIASVIVKKCEISLISLGEQMNPRICIAEENPIQGWVSPCYGLLKEAPVIVCEGEIQLPANLATGIYLGKVHGIEEQGLVTSKFKSMLDELKEKELL
jgi:hypothetical protein